MNIRFLFLYLLIISLTSHAQETLKTNQNNLVSGSGISVTIGGSFIINGTFAASPSERVDQFVSRIFNQAKIQSLMGLNDKRVIDFYNIELNNYAKRNITLKRISGQTIYIDLEKFRLTGDFELNPYLKNDDVLIFPKVDLERNFISIDGAINNPTKFQFVEGDKLSDALILAQGINPAYQNVTKAEITRLSYDGTQEEIYSLDLNRDFLLKPGDRIRVVADETFRKDYRVLVLGEINRPGYVSIARDNTSLKDVIAKVGGFKASADLYNAELIRASDSYSIYKKDILTKSFEQNKSINERTEAALYDNKLMEELLMGRMSYLVEEDTMYFKIDNELRMLRGNGLVDFMKLKTDTTYASNFILKDGDVILVPGKKDLVYIFGQVRSAGYVKYKEGADLKYYIQEAGGLGELAKDEDEISIIKAKSRSWFSAGSKDVTIESGDYIWVPKKTPRTFNFYLQRIGTIAGVVGSVATILLLFVQFKK